VNRDEADTSGRKRAGLCPKWDCINAGQRKKHQDSRAVVSLFLLSRNPLANRRDDPAFSPALTERTTEIDSALEERRFEPSVPP
jgi:hypothetical protein